MSPRNKKLEMWNSFITIYNYYFHEHWENNIFYLFCVWELCGKTQKNKKILISLEEMKIHANEILFKLAYQQTSIFFHRISAVVNYVNLVNYP